MLKHVDLELMQYGAGMRDFAQNVFPWGAAYSGQPTVFLDESDPLNLVVLEEQRRRGNSYGFRRDFYVGTFRGPHPGQTDDRVQQQAYGLAVESLRMRRKPYLRHHLAGLGDRSGTSSIPAMAA